MKRIWDKKGYFAIGLIVLMFIMVSITSQSAIQMLQGNARVVNYVGIVRGATQKLIKEEIMGWQESLTNEKFADESDWYPNNALIDRLDSIVDELITGVGPNNLIVLQDDDFLSNMGLVQEHWMQLKELIYQVRDGSHPYTLFESSQVYFELVNDTVFSAESYSEAQVSRTHTILIIVNGVFILLIVVGVASFLRGQAVKRRADLLGTIAYIDKMTKIDNRASCERLIDKLQNAPDDGDDIAVVMFDMNDLKLTNDFLGHKGGDRIIAAFGAVLKEATGEKGFIGRYGGDEFLAIFEKGNESVTEDFLSDVRARVEDYNSNYVHKLEKIQYAAGYSIANPKSTHIEDIIHEADNQMYQDKRRLKGIL